MYSFFHLSLLFLIYSIIGYFVEIITIYINFGQISFHRGFLLGPYLPVFGIGGILMNVLLSKYVDDPVALFCMAMILCTLVEYFASLILEKLFKLRWWDYQEKKFNLNGRVCLENAVGFGIGGVIFLKFMNPVITGFLDSMNHTLLIVIGIILFIIFIADLSFTLNSLMLIKIDFNEYLHKDATEEVKKQIKDRLEKDLFGKMHIFKAFPKTTYHDNKILDQFKEKLFEIKKERKLQKLKNKKKEIKHSKRDF